MILQALYDYYDRRVNSLPPMQMAWTNFCYAIVIDENGVFRSIEQLDDVDGTQLLTVRPEERTSAPVPHCLGDNGAYVLGLKDVKPDKPDKPFDFQKEMESNKKNFSAFVKDVKGLSEALPNNKNVRAIGRFYQSYGIETVKQMSQDVNWDGLCKSLSKNMTFRIFGETTLAASDQQVIKHKIDTASNENKEAICLITGQKAKPVNTTYSTFILGGKSNAKLVSFQVSSGYDSYGKRQGQNAPVSDEAEFKYTTALLSMLSKGSRNKFIIGNRTFLFWASKDDEAGRQAEESILNMFGFTEQEDDPNRNIEQVRKTFNAIYSGSLRTSLDDKFYILGLAPNSARIAVTYWSELPLKDFAARILRHFEDMEIADTRKEKKPYMGLRSILAAVTLGGKSSDATPNLPESVVKSIFQSLPYPYTLFAGCIRRIRAEQSLNITRAAIIKAYLNRQQNDNQKKIEVMLDKENTNQGYLCGRLFAVLDKIQEEANNQHSIRERYMNSASSTPAAVFSTILNLSYHHLEKLNEGRKIWFEKLKQEIVDKISPDGFPAHLDLQDQGRFFVGYYQQTQWFYTKKEE